MKTIKIKLTTKELSEMGWEIGNDSIDSKYQLLITPSKFSIKCSILGSNNEYADSGFTFDWIESIEDLRNYNHIIEHFRCPENIYFNDIIKEESSLIHVSSIPEIVGDMSQNDLNLYNSIEELNDDMTEIEFSEEPLFQNS